MLLSTSAVHNVVLECRLDRPAELSHERLRADIGEKVQFDSRVSLECPREASMQSSVRHGYIQKSSKQHDVTCRGDLYAPLSRMENSQTCAHSAMRDEEDVSKRQDGYEDDDTPQDAGVEEDEDGNEV